MRINTAQQCKLIISTKITLQANNVELENSHVTFLSKFPGILYQPKVTKN